MEVIVSESLFDKLDGRSIQRSLAQCLLAAHGGDISVCGEPERGSRFTFTLEAAVPAERD